MAERERFPRSSCCVPFCRRTSTRFRHEWLCADHWRLVSRPLKTYRTKRLRKLYRMCEVTRALCEARLATIPAGLHPDGGDAYWTLLRAQKVCFRRWHTVERGTWRRMKRQAIERATGIAA